MRRPGDRFRRLAGYLCSARTLERYVDPALADLQYEHANALRQQRRWRARWIHAEALWRLAQVLTMRGTIALSSHNATERVETMRAIVVSIGTTVLVTIVLRAIVVNNIRVTPHTSWLLSLLALVPAVLPVAVPIGLGVGASTLRRASSPEVRKRVIVAGVLCVAAMFVTMGWITPAANQWYRAEVTRALHIGTGPPPPGVGELTFPELVHAVSMEHGRWGVQSAAFNLHARVALSFSSVLFAYFGLAVCGTRPAWLVLEQFACIAAFLALYVVPRTWLNVFDSTAGAREAWLPNLMVLVITLLVHVFNKARPSAAPRRSEPLPGSTAEQ